MFASRSCFSPWYSLRDTVKIWIDGCFGQPVSILYSRGHSAAGPDLWTEGLTFPALEGVLLGSPQPSNLSKSCCQRREAFTQGHSFRGMPASNDCLMGLCNDQVLLPQLSTTRKHCHSFRNLCRVDSRLILLSLASFLPPMGVAFARTLQSTFCMSTSAIDLFYRETDVQHLLKLERGIFVFWPL